MKKLIAAMLSTALVISCTGLSVWADVIENNPLGDTIETINEGDWMYENSGTVGTNYGEVYENHGTVTDNYGTVKTNHFSATVQTNKGILESNQGIVENNYGTVNNNVNIVVNNYGGTMKGMFAQNNFYEIIVPNGVTLTNVTEADGRQWMKAGSIFTVTAMEGYSFTATPTFSNATVTVEQEGKSYTIIANPGGDVTKPFDLTAFILPPEQPEPAPTPQPKPEPKPEPKPDNKPSSSAAEDEARPDPADKKATEMYDFWQNVKRKIKNTEEGKTLRVAVPAEYTYMPASVMETLRLNPEVSLKLSWGRDTVMIKAGTAQPKQKLKAYWTKKQLIELYCK